MRSSLPVKNAADILRVQVINLVREYYKAAFQAPNFVPGENPVPYAGRIFDDEEIVNLVEAGLDFWLTSGRFVEKFEHEFADFFGLRHSILVNSGSSANLLALSCLTSSKLEGRRLRPGDEVITTAVGFPTTVNPILQNQLIPVFIDVTIPSYNADVAQLEKAYSERTRALILTHTLGNPLDLNSVLDFARRHSLWLIEDCCDSIGATYQRRRVGTFGDLATASFYPAHHITMGEGGAILTDSPLLNGLVRSFRDWGRDCWCDPGQDNTCKRRFEWQMGDLPFGYDHKYIYSHIGYNLKVTDMQAAVGVAQLKKLPAFIETRNMNFQYIYDGLKPLEEYFVLPEATQNSEPSWFGFPLAVRDRAPFTRHQVVQYLEERKIATRMLFGGNLVRQPAYHDIRCRIIGDLKNSDFVMNQVFWVGVFPGLNKPMLDYIIQTFQDFIKNCNSK